MFPTVEGYGGQLWGVLEVQTFDRLNWEVMLRVREEWRKQAKEGWGKKIGRRAIQVSNGELYLKFYNDCDSSMLMEQEVKGRSQKLGVRIIAEEDQEQQINDEAVLKLPASRFAIEEALMCAHIPTDGRYRVYPIQSDWPKVLSNALRLSGEKTLEEINFLAHKISQMDEIQLDTYEGIIQLCQNANIVEPPSIKQLINILYNLDSAVYHPGILNDQMLGELCLMGELLDTIQGIPDEVFDLLDEEKVGQELRKHEMGEFTRKGYIFPSDQKWVDVYDGIHLPEQFDTHDGVISVRLESIDSSTNQNSGIWLELPAEETAMMRVLPMLDVPSFEGCVIAEVRSMIPALEHQTAPDEDIDKLNTLAKRIQAFPDRTALIKYEAILELESGCNLDRKLDIIWNLDCYDYNPSITSPESYGKYVLQEKGIDIGDKAFSYFDFEGYGKRCLPENDFMITNYGMVSRNDQPFVQEYIKHQTGMTMQ